MRTCLSVTLHVNHLSCYEFKMSRGRGTAAWEAENHLGVIVKGGERRQVVSRWPWGLKGNNLKILFFPLISEYWKTIALFEGSQASPAFPTVRWRWVCSIGGMILTGENWFEYWNTSYSVCTYQIAVPASYTSPATIMPTSCRCSEAYKTRT